MPFALFCKSVAKIENIIRCDNCCFSTWIVGVGRPVLVCKERKGYVGSYRSVYLDSSCANFYPSELAKLGPKAIRPIPLTRGKFALVDAEDYYRLAQFNWHAILGRTTTYAARRACGKIVKMHRWIMDAPDHLVVDHIDHNGLNNTRGNLRLCTHLQNSRNRIPAARSTSKYKGVYWYKIIKKWVAGIYVNNKKQHIGCFENEIDAAKAYDKKAAEIFGEFACLNFPPSVIPAKAGNQNCRVGRAHAE